MFVGSRFASVKNNWNDDRPKRLGLMKFTTLRPVAFLKTKNPMKDNFGPENPRGLNSSMFG